MDFIAKMVEMRRLPQDFGNFFQTPGDVSAPNVYNITFFQPGDILTSH
jgi:hypothetical protein